MQNKTIDISFSALSAFTQCNTRFSYRYIRNIESRIQKPALSKGSVGHLVLQDWDWDLTKGFEIIDTEYNQLLADMQDSQMAYELIKESEDNRDYLKCAIADYWSYYTPWDEVVSQEERKVVKYEYGGYTFNFNFKIDKIIKKKETGKYWIIDHKFSKYKANREILNLSFQSATYYILANHEKQYFGVDEIGGVCFDWIKNPAKNLGTTAKGVLEKKRDVDKLLINRSCAGLGVAIDSPVVTSTYNYDALPDTNNLERIWLQFSPFEIEYYIQELHQVLDRLIFSYEKQSFPMTWNNYSCNGCEFTRLCYNRKVGNDVEGIIARDYKENKLLESDVTEND